MAHLDLGIDGLEPTPQQLSCTGLSEDIAVAPPATEEDICNNIANLSGQLTIVAITHREIWTDIADRIYEVQAGRATLVKGSAPGSGNESIRTPA